MELERNGEKRVMMKRVEEGEQDQRWIVVFGALWLKHQMKIK